MPAKEIETKQRTLIGLIGSKLHAGDIAKVVAGPTNVNKSEILFTTEFGTTPQV
jgi:hypothetical protein